MPPDKKKKVEPAQRTTEQELEDRGVALTPNGKAVIVNRYGELEETTRADALEKVRLHGASAESDRSKADRKGEYQRRKLVEGVPETIRAGGEAGVRAFTLNLSKLLEGQEARLREQHHGTAAAIGTGVATLAGIGTLFAPKALSAITPLGLLTKSTHKLGNKIGGLTGAIVEGGVEGGVFNMAHVGVNLAVDDKPLTFESAATDLLKAGLIGGGVGAVGGTIGYGLSSLAKKWAKPNVTPEYASFIKSVGKHADNVDDMLGRKVSDTFVDVSRKAGVDDITVGAPRRPGAKAAPLDDPWAAAARRSQEGTEVIPGTEVIHRRRGHGTEVMPGRGNRGLTDTQVMPRPDLDLTVGARGGRDTMGAAMADVSQAANAMRKAAGAVKGMKISKVLDSVVDDPLKAIKVAKEYDSYLKHAERVANLKGLGDEFADSLKAAQEASDILSKSMGIDPKMSVTDMFILAFEGLEVAETVSGQDIIPMGGPAVEGFLKMAAFSMLLKRGGFAQKMVKGGTNALVKQGLGMAAGRGGSFVARQAAGSAGRGGLESAMVSGLGYVAGRKLAAEFVDHGISGLVKSQNTTKGRIRVAVANLVNKTGKTRLRAPARAVAAQFLVSILGEPEGKSPQEKGVAQLKRFRTLMTNPRDKEDKITTLTSALAGISPEAKMSTTEHIRKSLDYLWKMAPKDPGVLSTFGKSRWQPSQAEMSEFMRLSGAIDDPASVFEDLANGRINPQGAKALKELYPAHFAEFQQHLLDNMEKLQELDAARQFQLGILFEIAINPMQSITQSLQNTWGDAAEARAKEQAQLQGGGGGGGLQQPAESLQEPTTAQQLTEKRF